MRYYILDTIYSWNHNIFVSSRVDFDNFYLKIVFFSSLVGWYPRTTLRVNKITMFKMFRCDLLKTNIKFEVTWWDGIGRVTWKIINWYHWVYNVTVIKIKLNDPNFLGRSHISIRQFYIGFGWDKHQKVWHAICDCNIFSYIFMK